MHLYTKTGDDGTTALFGGKRVPKDHPLVSCYGTVDELNGYVGLVASGLPDGDGKTFLHAVQGDLLVIGGNLAGAKIPVSGAEGRIAEMEKRMDAMSDRLPPIHGFILPTGNKEASVAHITRSVCRRAERALVTLKNGNPAGIDADVLALMIRYVNRLSDYLFALARTISHDAGTGDIPWTAGS